jgi:hypothetical protein
VLPDPARPALERREWVATSLNGEGMGPLSEGTLVLQPGQVEGWDTLGGGGLPDISEDATAVG